MNSTEDTQWIKEETDEFLRLAIIWPTALSKVFHLWGIILVAGIIGGVTNDIWLLHGLCAAGVGHALHKLNTYKKDITLISNEQSRRRQGAL